METNIVQESFRVNYFFKIEHFSEVIEKTDVEAALAAVIFHREEVPIEAVKDHMRKKGIETR
jgi:glutamine amidotransferase/cyclase